MKKTVLIILGSFAIMLASVVVISSCKKEKSETSSDGTQVETLMVTDVHNTDCLNSGVEKSDTIGGSVTLDRIGNNLYFDWSHCMSGCGLDSFAVRGNIIGDTLEIDVRAYGQWANCTCEYDLEATINNVPSKRYFVKLYYWIVTIQDIRGELWYSKWMNL